MSRDISDEVNRNLISFITLESKKEQTRFLGTNSYTVDPYDKTKEFQNAINLGAEFVVKSMGNGDLMNEDVEHAINSVKGYLKTIHFANGHELEKNTEDFLFKTAYCAPANYIPLLIKSGLDINAKRTHPFYTNIKGREEFPLLVFAARQGDLEKMSVLIKNGADTSYAARVVDLCQKSKVLTPPQKASVFNMFRAYDIDTSKPERSAKKGLDKETKRGVENTPKNKQKPENKDDFFKRAFNWFHRNNKAK